MTRREYMPGKILSKRVQEIAAEKGWSKEDLAEKTNLPIETIRNIWYGKTEDPKASTLLAISEATGHGINCLLGKCQHTEEERALLKHFRTCGRHGKNTMLMCGKYEALTAKEEREAKDKHRIKCLFPHGEIYHGIVYDTCHTEEIWTSVEEADSAIQMTNNCLMPIYCKNDVILITHRFPANNEYGVFYYRGKVYIRRYVEQNGQYILRCLHKHDADLVFNRMDEIEWIGTCIDVVRA